MQESTPAPKTTVTPAPAGHTEVYAVSQVDNRSSTGQAVAFQQALASSPRLVAQRQAVAALDSSPRQVAQRQALPNRTGLPDQLKAGVENLSGHSLDDVRVHYNSAKPAQLQAHAYAQGAEIHVAPGQEKHLPHEAWHVAQQKQGRVRATTQLKGVGVNEDSGLEKEADVMGARAMQLKADYSRGKLKNTKTNNSKPLVQSITQLKIKTKSGTEYSSISDKVKAPRLKQLIESKNLYYVKSDAEVASIRDGRNTPTLTNKKHLIGEEHDQSRFLEAVVNWGWAAGMLIEKYSQHKKLKSPAQTRLEGSTVTPGITDENYINKNAKGLEDAATKGLATAVNSKIFSSEALRLGIKIQDPAVFALLDQRELKNACANFYKKISPLSDVILTLFKYLMDSNSNWVFKEKLHDPIRLALTSKLSSEVDAGIANIKEQYDDPTNPILDTVKIQALLQHIDSIIKLMQDLVVAYDSGSFTGDDIRTMTTNATNRKSIQELSPLREMYMEKNILSASIPTLVQLGAAHANNLDGKIPNAISYDDYTDFESGNMSDTVAV